MNKMINLKFKLNGKKVTIKTEPHIRLIDLLRDKFNLTGTKEGCGIGECGACTVLMNKKAVNSCLILAVQVSGSEIETIESLIEGGILNPLQKNFLLHGAVQCGFCTPGMILTAKALLDENPKATEKEIKEAIRGNLCRCTGYVKIVEAIRRASENYRK